MKYKGLIFSYVLFRAAAIAVFKNHMDHSDALSSAKDILLEIDSNQIDEAHYRIGGNFREEEHYFKEGEISLNTLQELFDGIQKQNQKINLSMNGKCSIRAKLTEGKYLYIKAAIDSSKYLAVVQPYVIFPNGVEVAPNRSEGEYSFVVSRRIIYKVFDTDRYGRFIRECETVNKSV